VLKFTGLFEDPVMDASALAARQPDAGAARTTADQTGSDREWTYGHLTSSPSSKEGDPNRT
jgi:hypothetical protein